MEKKYGPKSGTKGRDKTASRYVARRDKFGPLTHGERSKGVGGASSPRTHTPRGGDSTKRPYTPRTTSLAPRAYTPRATSPRTRPYTPRSRESDTPKRAYTPRSASSGMSARAYSPRASTTPRTYTTRTPTDTRDRPYTPRTPRSDGPSRPYTPRVSSGGYAPRPSVRGAHAGKFGDKRAPYAPQSGTTRPYTSRSSSTYAPKRRVNTRSERPSFAKPARVLPPKKPRTASSSWDGVANWYDKHLSGTDTYHEKVLLPNLMRLMEPKSGDRILDLACGQGFFTRALKSAQADVEGVDIGSELIEIARNSMPDVTFHVGSAESPTMIPDASFNKALISLALQNIEHADRAIVSASRILTPKGELHIVLNHPAFRIPKRTSWGFDRKRMVQYRQVDAYLSISNSAIDMHPGMENSPQTISYHRPLQYYFKVFEKAGFAVARLEEWISHKDSDSGPRAEAENTARKEIPLFLYLKVIKLG